MAAPFSWLDQAQLPEPTPPVDVVTAGSIDDLPATDLAGNLTSALRFTGGAVTLNGMQVGAGVTYGRRIHLMAVGGALTLANSAGTSQAANRIVTGTGANVVIATGGAAWLVYDQTSQVWRLSGGSGGGGSATPGGSSGQVQWNSSGAFAGASFLTTDGSTWLGLGTGTLHTTAKLRLSYAVTDVIIGAKDSVGIDREIISRQGADSFLVGPSVAAGYNLTVQGYNLAIQAANKVTIAANGGAGFTALDTSGNILVLGSAAAGTSRASDVSIGATGTVGIGVGGLTFYNVNATTQRNEYLMPLAGLAGAAGYPLRMAKSTIQPTATNAVTLTNAQTATPILAFTTGGGVTAAVTVTPQNVDTEFHIVKNTCGFNVVFGAVTIATGTTAHILYENSAWSRCT